MKHSWNQDTGQHLNISFSDRFLHEYVEKKEKIDNREESFLLGYYAHLITDAECQRYIRDEVSMTF